jgi:hypothetical protein
MKNKTNSFVIKNTVWFGGLIALTLLLAVFGCKKNRNDSNLTVKMVDAPGDYQQVNIDLKSVEIHHEKEGWITLPSNPGIYDLLTLQNDVSAIIADPTAVPSGRIKEMRLILGGENTIMVDSIIYNLDTPSAEQSGLKFKLDQKMQSQDDYEIVIDFDAHQSIVEKGNDTYSLKPTIKMKSFNKK